MVTYDMTMSGRTRTESHAESAVGLAVAAYVLSSSSMVLLQLKSKASES